MARHSIQKFFGLILLYAVIIVGIFALQFRNQTIFSKDFYRLRLTLSQNKQENQAERPYDDTFFVIFKGVTFFSDKDSRPSLKVPGQEDITLKFLNWKQESDTMFTLFLTENVSIMCSLSGEKKDCLNIKASLPEGSQIYLPYKISKSYSITDSSTQSFVLKDGNTYAKLFAPNFKDSNAILSSAENFLSYSSFQPVKKFSFDSIINQEFADINLYNSNSAWIADCCANKFDPAADFSENAVNAFMAELSAKGRNIDANAVIPDYYKNGSRRTYISAPYLGSLYKMASSLAMQIGNLEYKANYSAEKQNLGIFETEHLADFLLTRLNSLSNMVCTIPSKMADFSPTITQAAGILQTYSDLVKNSNQDSSLLAPYLDRCVKAIENASVYENDRLYLAQNNEKLPAVTQISIGNSLYLYGKTTSNASLKAAGIMIVNSNIAKDAPIDQNTAAEIYAILNHDNPFLPHFKVLEKTNDSVKATTKKIWCWTVAQDVKYSVDEDNSISIITKFPQGASHYMILQNIEPFSRVEIYGIKFRTDPRFETYNSSGYVYISETKTLLLKYRHKAEQEIVKLYYDGEEMGTPAATAPSQGENQTVNQTPSKPASSAKVKLDADKLLGKWVFKEFEDKTTIVEGKFRYLEFTDKEKGMNANNPNGWTPKEFKYSISGNTITFSGTELKGSFEAKIIDSQLHLTISDKKTAVYSKK